MPELPEVETVRRTLLPHLCGKTIEHVEVLHPKPVRDTPELVKRLQGQTIRDITRRGKLLMLHFDALPETLCIHLKMTGQLLYLQRDVQAGGGHTLTSSDMELPHAHTRITVYFTDAGELHFNDLRLFGYFKLVSQEMLQEMLADYGIEPGQASFTWEAFDAALGKRHTSIKALLLNQSVISGLGNIYVDEVCFAASVRPQREVANLSKAERKKMYTACDRIVREAVELGGTTFHYYRTADGRKGGYRAKLQVFGRKGLPCFRCSTPITKEKFAGRGTHWCSGCQE